MANIVEQQINDVAEELKALAPEVTELQKADFMSKTGVGITTINRYLKGEVANLLTGKALLGFLKGEYTVSI